MFHERLDHQVQRVIWAIATTHRGVNEVLDELVAVLGDSTPLPPVVCQRAGDSTG